MLLTCQTRTEPAPKSLVVEPNGEAQLSLHCATGHERPETGIVGEGPGREGVH